MGQQVISKIHADHLFNTPEARGSSPLSPTIKSSQKFTKELFDKFLASRPPGTSPRTIQDYEQRLGRFLGYELSPEGINQYLNSLSCGNGRVNYYSCVRSLCNWLYRNDFIADNPIIKVSRPRRQRKLLPAISKEQLAIIVGKAVCFRDKCIISLLFDSGIRVSEIARIQATDFNWDNSTVVILGKGNKQRKAIFTDDTAIMLMEWFEEHDSFGISMAGIQTMLKRLDKDIRIPCHPHSFRRGFCVHQVKQGLSTRVVQALGGWENITMVERYSKSLNFDDAFKLYQQVNGR